MPRAVKPKAPTPEGSVKLEFAFQESQVKLFKWVKRGAGTYLQLIAPQCLEVGGYRSGKTSGKLMYGVIHYCLAFAKCDILVLRRTTPELDKGAISDFKTFVPEELYDFNHTTKTATFKENGSRVVFGSCPNDVERDIEKYLGQAYPFILVDECTQFSADVWEKLYARNSINPGCQPDKNGNFPIPAIVGCTNPLGAHWGYYHTKFVLKEPVDKPEGSRRAQDGSWWVQEGGEWACIYKPSDYAVNHSTVLTNLVYRKRDPGYIERLMALPKAKRDKMLFGLMDGVEGQYFDCFSPEYHVRDLRSDPEAIIWQDWQPVWGGQDWGMGHWNAFYLFTKALVRRTIGDDYALKTVCFREVAPDTTGHTNRDFVDMIDASAYYPKLPETHQQYSRISGRRCEVRAIYFSHEKFNRVMEAHSPADEYTKLLRAKGLPPVSRATRDRIGSASYMYNQLKSGHLVILSTCTGIINAIPRLPRDPDQLDDVEKLKTKDDDRYDAFRYGLYGEFQSRGMPQEEADAKYAKGLTPMARFLYLHKKKFENEKTTEMFRQKEVPIWQTKFLSE